MTMTYSQGMSTTAMSFGKAMLRGARLVTLADPQALGRQPEPQTVSAYHITQRAWESVGGHLCREMAMATTSTKASQPSSRR